MEKTERTTKLIFNAGVARRLVRDYGCTICDLKPSRENNDKTIFVFTKDDKFDAAMEAVTRSIREEKE